MYQIFFYLLYFLQHFLNFFKLPHGHLSLGFGLFVLTFGFCLHSVLWCGTQFTHISMLHRGHCIIHLHEVQFESVHSGSVSQLLQIHDEQSEQFFMCGSEKFSVTVVWCGPFSEKLSAELVSLLKQLKHWLQSSHLLQLMQSLLNLHTLHILWFDPANVCWPDCSCCCVFKLLGLSTQ